MGAEKHEFQAEVAQLLDLMIHSLYTNRDVFLRELVSNASDALDWVRFAGLTDADLLPDEPLRVDLRVDSEARTLEIRDNGIGMSREEVVSNLAPWISDSPRLKFRAFSSLKMLCSSSRSNWPNRTAPWNSVRGWEKPSL